MRSSCILPAILQHLPGRKQVEFHRRVAIRRFRAGASVIWQGDSRTTLPLVCRGLVVTSVLTEGGEDIARHVCGTGTFIGLMDWLLQRPAFSVSAEALVETTVALLRPDALLQAVEAEHGLLVTLLKQLGSQADSSERRFAAGRSHDANHRLLHCLLDLAQQLGFVDHGSFSLSAEVTHTRLAQLTGLARETVSRCLRKLARAGLIAHGDRGIVIPCVTRAKQALRKDRLR
jgi:CRP-like cAMP-binding protein